jgi:hypothetical protein
MASFVTSPNILRAGPNAELVEAFDPRLHEESPVGMVLHAVAGLFS